MTVTFPKSIRAGRLLCTVMLLAALWGSMQAEAAAVKGLYVGSDFYPPSEKTQTGARTAGFTRLFLSYLNVDERGDITFNDALLVRDGVYVGDPSWKAKLASLKQQPTSVDRVELVIRSGAKAGEPSASIRNLVATNGTGPSSILYRDMIALKEATGADAIQFADDGLLDEVSTVALAKLVSALGLKATFQATGNPDFWARVTGQLGNSTDSVYLVCYGEGRNSSPGDWAEVMSNTAVYPGLWGNTDTTTSAMLKMRHWRGTLGIPGGFMWLNGFMPDDAGRWASALSYGLDPMASLRIVNKSSGRFLNLVDGGLTNGSAISQAAFRNGDNQRWMLAPTDKEGHFTIVSWVSGKCASVAYDSCLVGAQLWAWDYNNDPSQQFDLIDAGNGWFEFKNARSGMVLEVAGGGTSDNATIQQNVSTGAASQLWKLYPDQPALLAFEHFDYPPGPLSGRSGGEGWDGNWSDVLNAGPEVRPGSLSGQGNVPAEYDAHSLGNSAFIPNDKRAGRYLDCSATGNFGAYGYLDANGRVGADGRTLYISFLEQPGTTALFYEFELNRGMERIAGIGNDTHSDDVHLRAPAGLFTRIAAGNTNVNFYVMRIDFKPGNDDVRVYRNPNTDGEPEHPTLLMHGVADLSFNRISLGAFANDNTARFDEIRIASTWQSAVAAGSEFETRPGSGIDADDLFRQVHLSAQVLCGDQDDYYLLDGRTPLRVSLMRTTPLEAGDIVAVTGLVKRKGPLIDLIEARARKTGHLPLPIPQSLNVQNSAENPFWVSVEGILTGLKDTGAARELELRVQSKKCVARFYPATKALGSWAIGSRLRLTGVYLPPADGEASEPQEERAFGLLLNSLGAVQVIASPPWWTLKRAMIAIGVLVASLALAFVWIRSLQRQVGLQTIRLRTEIIQREQAERERAIEEERSRISRNLHDDLGSMLTQINMLANYSTVVKLPPETMQERIRLISDKSHRMITTLDEVVWMMNTRNESLSSMAGYVAAYAEEFLAKTNIVCRIEAPASYPEKAVTAEVRNNVFSSVKEALNNAVRHAKPNRILVKLAVVADTLEIHIQDDGVGFAPATVKRGDGLDNLELRMQKVGGACRVHSFTPGGTTVILQLPLVPSA
jgi:signal transduction histidine kinase